MKIFYKIVEIKDNNYYFLFHGINGTRKITFDTWIKANIKENVMDGHGTKYTSGIHIIDGYENALDYMKKFKKNNRIIIKYYAKNLKPKTKSKSYVFLADKIKFINL